MYSVRRSTGRITPTRKLVKKGSSLRDLRPLTERVVLEKVLGVTVSGNSGLACNPVSGNIAYAAGKTVSSLAFSPDGKFLVSGESGHQPAVRVWDAEDISHPQVSEMPKAHKHGIQCVAFSPNMKYVVSVGFQHDMLVNIWNWREGTTIACNKVSSKVNAVSFSEKGDYFVTVGVRIVKFWYIDSESSATKVKKKIPLLGRPAILGEKRDNHFIDVACGVGTNSSVSYCVTKSGLLCSFNEKRLLDKWVELRVNGAYSLTINEHLIFCGCSDGIIRVFNSSSLQFIGTLPKPHCLGVDVAAGLDASHLLTKVENATYPDTVAITLDHQNAKLTCVYNDHSIYIWDVKDIKKIGKISSFLYHNSCVWGVEVYPEIAGNYQSALPYGSFLTCSSDGTVRVWNIETGPNMVTQKNIYSKELMRVLYTEKELTHLKDTKGHAETGRKDSESKPGVRCLKLCHVGQQLATGDRMGNIRVFDLAFMDEIIKIEAHESEVLSIEYSSPDSGHKLLTSAGRDRLIHVFDCENNFNLLQTIDDHSASITSVKFNVSESKDFQLISCAADKSVIFRSAQKEPELQFSRYTNVATKTTFYDMDIHPSGKYAVTAGQDRNLRVYDISSGKQTRSFKGSMGDDGLILKVLLDRSGFYAVTSCSDKSLSLYDFELGECVAGMVGHSEVVTGLQFSVDCKRLITVSGDGCVFVWKLPSAFSQNMSEKLSDQGSPKEEILLETPSRRETYTLKSLSQIDGVLNGEDFKPAMKSPIENGESSPPDNDYRFSMGKLPSWAKKQIANHDNVKSTVISETIETSTTIAAPQQPAGKWAERFNQINLKIQPDSPTATLEESPERKRLSSEPTSLHGHIQVLARTPLEKRSSSESHDEEQDVFFQDAKAALLAMEREQGSCHKVEDIRSKVTTSRGSDSFLKTVETRKYTGNGLVHEMTEQAKEIDVQSKEEQDIIYYPTEEDIDSEVASLNEVSDNDTVGKVLDKGAYSEDNQNSKLFQETSPSNQPEEVLSTVNTTDIKLTPNSETVKRTRNITQDWRVPLKKRSLEDILRSPSESDEIGYFEIRPGHSMDNLVIHEVEFTQLGRRRSEDLLDGGTPYDVKIREDSEEDKYLESQNTETTSRDETDEKSGDSVSDEELSTEEIIPKWDELSEEPAPVVDRADVENSKEFLMENFECLGSTPTHEKDEYGFKSGPEAVPEEPLPFDRNSFHRTSISARFILRSKQSSMRSAKNPIVSQNSEVGNIEEKNKELEKRREELASTKKRLEALGFQSKDNWSKAEKSGAEPKGDELVKTEMGDVTEKQDSGSNQDVPAVTSLQNSVVNVQENSDETRRLERAELPSSSNANDLPGLALDVVRLPSPEPAPFPGPVLSSEIPGGPSQASTVPQNSFPGPSPSNIPLSTENTVESITQNGGSSRSSSPNHSSHKTVKSPKGTLITSFEVTDILHAHDEERPQERENGETNNRTSNEDSHVYSKISESDNKRDEETSSTKRASELIAFFDPGQKHKPTKEGPRTTSEKRQSSETRLQNKAVGSISTKRDTSAKTPKHLRQAKLPLLSKPGEKTTTHNRRSFPLNITRIMKNKGPERKSSKSDLAKAKSCGDLLKEQAKEGAFERKRRSSQSRADTVFTDERAASALLEKEATKISERSLQVDSNTNVSKLSELSAELTAALATPPPKPIQLNISRNYLLDADNLTSSSRHQAAGVKKGFSDQITKNECREVVVDLVRAFERALECHSKILQGDNHDDQQQVLSMLSATFSTIQESIIDCKRDRERKTRSPRARMSEQRSSTELAKSPNKEIREVSQQTEHTFSYAEQEKMLPLLEKYSELLLEKLDRKINDS